MPRHINVPRDCLGVPREMLLNLKTNLKAVANFYRGSALRYEWFEKISDTKKISICRFPAYFEVRFAEHLLNLSTAIWKNLPCMQTHWESIIESSHSTKIEKATAFKCLVNEDIEEPNNDIVEEVLRKRRNVNSLLFLLKGVGLQLEKK